MNPNFSGLCWGDHALHPDQWHTIEDLCLFLSGTARETSVSYCYARAGRRGMLQYTPLNEVRYPGTGELACKQQLAARPVVASPNAPIHLAADESVTLYVGTSLCFQLVRGTDVLLDLPVALLSDSWFGPDTMQGEVCYACQTHARLSMDGVRKNPGKAITAVTIDNKTSKPMLIDRVNIPVPNLALYRDAERLWTSSLRITRRVPESTSEVVISPGVPDGASEVAKPRKAMSGSILDKAIGLLLG